MAHWPKFRTLHALMPGPVLREIGRELGLEGAALRAFVRFECVLDVSIAQTGVVTVVRCNGRRLPPGRPRKAVPSPAGSG